MTTNNYRINKFISDLKAARERCREEPDINVLTSLVKLYFRELPEALFTDVLYSKLLEGISKYYN